jgi:hypothetical protein
MMTGLLIFAIFSLCGLLLGSYTLLAPWWTRRSSQAYFGLMASLWVLSGYFLIEELAGQMPQWAEDSVLALVAAAIGWNLYTIIWKQLTYWRKSHPAPSRIPFDKEP